MNYRSFLIPAIVSAFAASSCTEGNRTAENPLIEASNTMTIDISRVELTDSSTIVDVDAYFIPGYWIRIDSGTYLQSNGRKYRMTGTHGIQADSLFWMPESGEASFRLEFEPLPKGTESFDFIESDCEDCFRLYGVDLTGRKEYARPEGIPSEALKADGNATVPGPVFKSGMTVLNVHIPGYREGLMKTVDIYVNTLFGEQQSHSAQIDPESGTARIEFQQFGTAQVFMPGAGQFWIAPGEETDIYYDIRSTGQRLVRRRAEKAGIKEIPALQALYTTGTYACLNNIVSEYSTSKIRSYDMDLYNGEFTDWKMSAEEYTGHVISRYRSLSDSIAESNAPSLLKDMQLITLKQEAITAAVNGDFFREHNYRCANDMWDHRQKVEGIDSMKTENIAHIFSTIGTDDPSLLMGYNVNDYIRSICALDPDQAEAAGCGKGLENSLRHFCRIAAEIQNDKASDQDMKDLESLDDPFFAEAASIMRDNVRARLAETEAVIEHTPDVPLERLFESIIAPHKGKVILVDFWNTWCSPCRAALEANEPVKEADLKSDDIVWIYIANETSPIVRYKTMIPGIKGLHYRLNDREWKYITGENMLDIDGIPSYVLVDRHGQYRLRNDFRDHNLMVKTLKEMIQ